MTWRTFMNIKKTATMPLTLAKNHKWSVLGGSDGTTSIKNTSV